MIVILCSEIKLQGWIIGIEIQVSDGEDYDLFVGFAGNDQQTIVIRGKYNSDYYILNNLEYVVICVVSYYCTLWIISPTMH